MFMAYKDSLQVDDMTLFKSMRVAAKSGVLSLVHAENGDAIEVLTADAIAAGQTCADLSRPDPPGRVGGGGHIARPIWLAQVAGNAPLFVVHCTCAGR